MNKNRTLFIVGIISFVCLFSHLVTAAEYHRTKFVRTIPLTIIIKDKTKTPEQVFADMQATFDLGTRYFNLWSLQNPLGDISRINQRQNKIIQVSPDTITLLEEALKLRVDTQGYFNIFYPSPPLIKNKNTHELIAINRKKSQVRLKQNKLKIDTNGIAKGAILDLLKNELSKKGYVKFMINAGGDLITSGRWRVCIKEPAFESTDCGQKISVNSQAVMTTGNYERGRHVKNPFDSQIHESVQSATVIAATATQAGPWAVTYFLNPKLYNRQKKSTFIEGAFFQ